MPNITLKDLDLNYSVRYSKKRRSVQIRILELGQVLVSVPTGFPADQVEKFLKERQTWIIRHMKRLADLEANPANKSVGHGASILFAGKPRTLLIAGDGGLLPHVTLTDTTLTIHMNYLVGEPNDPDVQKILRQWLVKEAGRLLLERTQFWSAKIGVSPKRLTLRDQKTRWGSCSSSGGINYNWRIVMAAPEIIDYLVVHELCHLRYPNHSAAYWQEVAKWVPQYASSRRWLRLNGRLLMNLFT